MRYQPRMMRIPALLFALSLAFAGAAHAIPYFPPPQPVFEAPIDRALANVAADTNLDVAQRERILGRLNLLAFARDDAPFTYLRDSERLNLSGSVSCADAAQHQMRSAPPADPPAYAPDDRCAQFEFNLGPSREILDADTNGTSPAARTRLEAARRHYATALTLENDDLRAHLGLAYALDRLGRTGQARSELRSLIRLGLPKLAGPTSAWEDHAVLTEAATHLAHLAKSRADRQRVAQLQTRLGASQPMIYITPMVVPLRDESFDALVNAASPVAFDFAGTGDRRAQGWLGPDAAWLVWDPNGRADMRSGFDLIGARTWAVFWRDGFEVLRALDDDRSGDLSGAELGGLALWRDANGDGRSTPAEVQPLAAHGIVSLSVRGQTTRPGLMTAPGGVRLDDGASRPLYDWTPGLTPATRGAPILGAPVS
jgi:hypothetical protein